MKFSELKRGDLYKYPRTDTFGEFPHLYMKTDYLIDIRWNLVWNAVCVSGDERGVLVSHEFDPLWDEAEVTVYEVV